MNVLVACEESQRVCLAFLEKGHNSFSCDVVPCSGGRPDRHIQHDVLPLLSGGFFYTADQVLHYVSHWDLIIAHPPCTHLSISGSRWFNEGKKPLYLRDQAADFFMKFVSAPCNRVCIENPVSVMSTRYRKPDQYIQPYMFGHPEQKKTGLWLRGLPKLHETNNVYDYMMTLPVSQRCRVWYLGGGSGRERSKTFPGVAAAMASQWGDLL